MLHKLFLSKSGLTGLFISILATFGIAYSNEQSMVFAFAIILLVCILNAFLPGPKPKEHPEIDLEVGTVAQTNEPMTESLDLSGIVASVSKAREGTVDLLSTVSQCLTDMDRATVLAKASGALIQSGVTSMNEIAGTLNSLHSHVTDSSEVFQSLQTRVSKISEIVSTIKSIAQQTNLLAINAAIEASRAGNLGRGFGVVAKDIKSLAKRTDDASAEVNLLVRSLAESCRIANGKVSEAASATKVGKKMTEKSLSQMKEIQDGAGMRVRIVGEIVQGLEAQRNFGEIVLKRLTDIDEEIHSSSY